MILKLYTIKALVQHSVMLVLQVEQTGDEDPNVFVCYDKDQETGSSSEESSSEPSGSGSPAEEPPAFIVYPNRTLVSVASLTDLEVHPIGTPTSRLYRASTVTLMFVNQAHADRVYQEILNEVRINSQAQRVIFTSMEIVEATEPRSPSPTTYAFP